MNIIVPDQGKIGPSGTAADPLTRTVHITAARKFRGRAATALDDLRETLRLWPLVWALSVFDIRLRYRGSMLGPFWLTLSTAIMVAAIGFLYAKLFHADIAGYLPFLSISLVLWNFINTMTSEGCVCLTQSEGMIRAMRMPLTLHAARVVMRNILVLGHNIIVIVVVFALFGVVPSTAAVTVIPACALWLVDALAISLLLGIFGARFRDIPPIVGSIIQIAFYLTPIMWSPAMLMHRGIGKILIDWNPFYALLEIMRGPLLGLHFNLMAWAVALGYSAFLIVLAGAVFIRVRPRIAYWV